jgi:CBS domain-containing protein
VNTVRELMTSDVLSVDPSDTIGETAQQMVERRVSSAVVSDYGNLIGIVTERDLTRAVAGRVHSSEARVREWMTADPLTLTPDATPADAAKIMLDNGFRHVPIVEDGRAVGIVSIRDVARWSTEES